MSNSQQKLFEGYEKGPDQKWTIPSDGEGGVYRFILAAARRARQLQSGQRPLINTTLRKSTKIAMEEIRTGAVAVEIVPEGEAWPPQPAYGDTAGPEVDALGPLPEIAETAAAPDSESMADTWADTSGENAKGPADETPVAFRPQE